LEFGYSQTAFKENDFDNQKLSGFAVRVHDMWLSTRISLPNCQCFSFAREPKYLPIVSVFQVDTLSKLTKTARKSWVYSSDPWGNSLRNVHPQGASAGHSSSRSYGRNSQTGIDVVTNLRTFAVVDTNTEMHG
jgi:hypothetical protein